MGTTTTIEVTGEIQTSLYVALEEKLNANAAQRIAWLLQSRDVPLTTLPKGSTFSVRIEQDHRRGWRDAALWANQERATGCGGQGAVRGGGLGGH